MGLHSHEVSEYRHALQTLEPSGVPLSVAVNEYTQAWKVLAGRASLLDAAREYARQRLHERPDISVADAVGSGARIPSAGSPICQHPTGFDCLVHSWICQWHGGFLQTEVEIIIDWPAEVHDDGLDWRDRF